MSAAHHESLCKADVLQHCDGLIKSAKPVPGSNSVQNWIFTPSSGRASGQRQAFMNWSQAVSPNVSYVRVLVVKSKEKKQYLEAVKVVNRSCKPMQQTLVMTMPDELSLGNLQGLSEVYKDALKDGSPDASLGVGYSRLCIQLVAHTLQLSHVWMLDDNIQDCWQINLQAESLRASPSKHGKLQPCSFDTIMCGIEEQVSSARRAESSPSLQLSHAERYWKPARSPRKDHAPAQQGAQVLNWFDYGGSSRHYAVIGPNRQPYRYSLVGATWPGGAGPPPFKITHSVFSFFLLNVEATMSAKVLWPARQYAEDIEFHHMCEERRLAVVKCNRFFFHKTNLQGADLRTAHDQLRATFHPAQGPMWGGQELHIRVLPLRTVSSVTVCGATVSTVSNEAGSSIVVTPALSTPVLGLPFGQSSAVLSSSITVKCHDVEAITAEGQYVYHGFWKWSSGTGIDTQSFDTGKLARHLRGIYMIVYDVQQHSWRHMCFSVYGVSRAQAQGYNVPVKATCMLAVLDCR